MTALLLSEPLPAGAGADSAIGGAQSPGQGTEGGDLSPGQQVPGASRPLAAGHPHSDRGLLCHHPSGVNCLRRTKECSISDTSYTLVQIYTHDVTSQTQLCYQKVRGLLD